MSGLTANRVPRLTRQAQKSDQTRRAILDAAIRCLAEIGYNKTTMTAIARRAGVSRGAMQYHFETMQDVLRATIDHIEDYRRQALTAAGERSASRAPDDSRFKDRVDTLWVFLSRPPNVAFFELTVAGRANADLNKALREAQRRFMEDWVRIALEAFPEWESRRADLELACGVSQALLEGLRLREMNGQVDAALAEASRCYLADRIRDIFKHGDRNSALIEKGRA